MPYSCLLKYFPKFHHKDRIWSHVNVYRVVEDFLQAWCRFSEIYSWHTLKREGSAVLSDEKKDPPLSVSKIPPGHYNLEGVAKVIDGLFEKYQYRQLETKINTPVAILEIKNLGAKK